MTNKELGEAYREGSGRLVQRILETIENTPKSVISKDLVLEIIHQTKELFDEESKKLLG